MCRPGPHHSRTCGPRQATKNPSVGSTGRLGRRAAEVAFGTLALLLRCFVPCTQKTLQESAALDVPVLCIRLGFLGRLSVASRAFRPASDPSKLLTDRAASRGYLFAVPQVRLPHGSEVLCYSRRSTRQADQIWPATSWILHTKGHVLFPIT